MLRITLLLALALSLPVSAEILQLGSGRSVRGKVVKETSDTVFVDVGYTILPVPKKEILSRSKETANKGATKSATKESKHLYSTIQREEKSVKDNVDRTAGGVVMVSTPSGLGSGFIISKDGYVVTNDHVVQGETKITVTIFSQNKDGSIKKRKVEKVKIVALNAYLDLALLKMDGEKNLPIVYLGDSDALKIGQPVYARRQPARSRAQRLGRHRLDARATLRGARLSPDDDADQPGQLGRPALQPEGRGGRRHETWATCSPRA